MLSGVKIFYSHNGKKYRQANCNNLHPWIVIIGEYTTGRERGCKKLVTSVNELKSAATGDPDSIEQICLATWEPLYRFIYYKVQNREEAEEITQDTYVKTLTYLQEHKYNPENFAGLLKTIALNLVRDRWRQKKRRGITCNFEETIPIEKEALDEQKYITERLQIEDALAKLSEDQRTIIDLRIIKGYSVAETAQQVRKTEASVRTTQYRALQSLSKILYRNE